jgi:hypothetical protein
LPNPPKPAEVKRRLGNPGKRTLPDKATIVALPGAVAIPEPSRPLGEQGGNLWARVWSSGGTWVAPGTDSELVLLLCEAMDERVQLRTRVLEEGDWRDRVALRALDGQVVSMLSALGFTPTERSRLGVAEVTAQSKLEEMLSKRRRQS